MTFEELKEEYNAVKYEIAKLEAKDAECAEDHGERIARLRARRNALVEAMFAARKWPY